MRRQRTRSLALCVVLGAGPWACEDSSPTQPTPPACTYAVSAESLSFAPSGGTSSVAVATSGSCVWTASSDRGWIIVTSGGNGAGPGTVTVSVTANDGAGERGGALTIAGHAVLVRQDGAAPCTVEISPGGASYSKDSATGSFAVTAAEHCGWSASSNAGWLTVASGGQGRGNGTVGYGLERNRDVTSRTAAITVADRSFIVTQAGDPPASVCDYSLTPIQFTPCMSVPYDLAATMTTQQGCTWTVEADSSWITVTGGQSGAGPGIITFRVSDNWDAPRQSVVKVRWPSVTAGQNLQVLQAGCRYALSVNAVAVGVSGGPGRFDVIQQSDPYTCGGPTQDACVWTAQASVPWITVTTMMPRRGDQPVSFTVAPNGTGSARTGLITVRDRAVQISQAGQ